MQSEQIEMKQYEENKMFARLFGDAFVKIKSEWIFLNFRKLNRFFVFGYCVAFYRLSRVQ